MAIDDSLCASLSQATASYDTYVPQAVHVVAGPLADTPPGPPAAGVLTLEIIHTDAVCQTPLADACIHLRSGDEDIRFVAPDIENADNYVSYWHREAEPTGQQSGWAPLSAGQTSKTHEALLLGQTLPTEIVSMPQSGAGGGYLHHETDRPTDGWTVRVGVLHPGGRQALTGQVFEVAVSARPFWSSTTAFQLVTLD